MSGPAHSAPAPYGVNVWDVPLPKAADEMKVFHGILPDFKKGSKRCVLAYSEAAYISGGAIFASEDSSEMVGSWIILRALSAQHAREMLEQDVYTTGGAWDPSQFELRPIAVAPLAQEGEGGSFAAYLESATK
ncbi:hypothetical protein JCM3770_000293 [Rhodotorula araucariae]